jgi:calcineurin-like phosphoesterase family protein
MTPLYKTSDWHLGVNRVAGCTPATSYQLRQELLQEFKDMLCNIAVDGDLLLNGDLFDTASIPMSDLAQVFQMLSAWLERNGKRLILPNGNHDLSKNSTNFSSYQFLAKLLSDAYPLQVTHIVEGTNIGDGCYVVPHVSNQDTLELELKKIPKCRYAFFHANFANVFAEQSDHSLSISEAQVAEMPVETAVFSHEHIGRTAMSGKVLVVGNARPSSISDCLGNVTKRMLKITDAGIEFIETWKAEGDYIDLPWQELQDTGARFVRVVGTATTAEAAQVITTLAQFRQKSKALIISSAVKIDGQDDSEELNLSHEQISSFNVLNALLEILTPAEGVKVVKLLEKRNAAKT